MVVVGVVVVVVHPSWCYLSARGFDLDSADCGSDFDFGSVTCSGDFDFDFGIGYDCVHRLENWVWYRRQC